MVICLIGELGWIKLWGRLTEIRNAIEDLVSYLWIVLVIVHIQVFEILSERQVMEPQAGIPPLLHLCIVAIRIILVFS